MRRVRTAGVGKELVKRAQTERFIDKVRDPFTISAAYSDGTVDMDLKTGPYTYQFLQFMVRSASAITGETILRDGKHYVKTEFLSKYISRMRLDIDGVTERDLTMDQMVNFNASNGYDVQDGQVYMVFGGPYQFDDKRIEDVYALGTGNLRTVSVRVDLTSDWVNGTMFMEGMAEYTSARRPVTHLRTIKQKRYSPSSSGEYTIADLPIHSDIGAIYVLGADIKSAKLEIDGVEVMDVSNYKLKGINKLYGNSPEKLGEGMVFDFMRSREITKALKSLERMDQRKRNANIAITLNLGSASELNVIVDQIGRYATQG